MPGWVVHAFELYASRMPRECAVQLIEIPAEKRNKSQAASVCIEREGGRLLAAIPKDCWCVALDVTGRSWSTSDLAGYMQDWLQSGRDVALMIGGADGLSQACLQRADMRWSLSALTFPHPMVRVILAEQLYRAWSIIQNHPYHRE